MANIKEIIEKLEKLHFVEIVLETNNVFFQREDVKVFLGNAKVTIKKYNPETMQEDSEEVSFSNPQLFEIIISKLL